MPWNGSDLDVAGLRHAAQAYVCRLRVAPDDCMARMGLAWCLFLEALHQSGRECVAHELAANSALDDAARYAQGIGSLQLMRESLRQGIRAKHLSSASDTRIEVQRLKSLVRLAGWGDLVDDVESEVQRPIEDLAAAVCAAWPGLTDCSDEDCTRMARFGWLPATAN